MSLTIAPKNHELDFLNQSNLIECIDDINYTQKEFQDPEKGHFGAYVYSQQLADDHKPLTVKIIRKWQELIGREQQQYTRDDITEEKIGHIRGPSLPLIVRVGNRIPPHFETVPTLIQALIEDVNEDLEKNCEKYRTDDAAFSKFAAHYFWNFEMIHPFGDGNGRTGRILANYLATYCGRPIIVFPSAERNTYMDAHKSEEAMSEYIADHLPSVRTEESDTAKKSKK